MNQPGFNRKYPMFFFKTLHCQVVKHLQDLGRFANIFKLLFAGSLTRLLNAPWFGNLPETTIFAPENCPIDPQKESHLNQPQCFGRELLASGRLDVFCVVGWSCKKLNFDEF